MTNQQNSYCKSCEIQLDGNWIICPNCERETQNSTSQICPRCFQVIKFDNPKWCPFCQLQISKEIVSHDESRSTQLLVTAKSKPQEVITINPSDNSFTNNDIKGFLAFNFSSTVKIMEDRNFSTRAFQLLLISSVSSALLLVFITILFDMQFGVSFMNDIFEASLGSRLRSNQPPRVTSLRRALLILLLITGFQFAIYLGFALASTFILKLFNSSFNYQSQIRFTSGIAISFLIRDGFILLLSLYVFIFEGKGGGSIIFDASAALTIVFTFYFLLHGMVLIRKGIGGGFLQSFIIVLFIFFFTYIFTLYTMIIIIQLEALLR